MYWHRFCIVSSKNANTILLRAHSEEQNLENAWGSMRWFRFCIAGSENANSIVFRALSEAKQNIVIGSLFEHLHLRKRHWAF